MNLGRSSEIVLARRTMVVVLVAIALLALAALIWRLSGVLLMVFGSVLIATILHAIGDPIARRTALSRNWALLVTGLIVVAVIGGTAWLFAAQVGAQISEALQMAESAIPAVGNAIGVTGLSEYVATALRQAFDTERAFGVGYTAIEVVANTVLVIIAGIYLAISPDLYRDGVVMLFPHAARPHIADALNTSGSALRLWLFGQFFSMLTTGTLTWLIMWLLGLPSAAGLGLIAGVTEFIPLLGPFLGAVPALLIALAQGPAMALWVAIAFVVIQQIEAHLIQPLITRAAVSLPPALLVFTFVAFGTVYGATGILFAAPLTVVVFVFVKKLYVRETLGENTVIPGEPVLEEKRAPFESS
ncbi:AI-2E family transporter [Microvirga sp. M2]|uniref:AI-2E family transporter n=1 Tax=Microvirga sp. M2 TaxID=3073270 RepID=UPI0039C1DD84